MSAIGKELGAVTCCLAISTAAGWSQETIIQRSVTRTTPSSTMITSMTSSPRENLDKRLRDIHSWINKGMNNGWLTFLQVSNFDQQVEQLRGAEASLEISNGVYDRKKVNAMEKAVNQLSIDVGQAMKNKSVAGRNSTQ